MPPSIWPMHRQRVERPADVLGGGDLHDLAPGPSSASTSTTARWATNANATWQLPWPSLVELLGRAVVVLDGLLEALTPAVASATATRSDAHGVDDVGALDRQAQRIDAVRRARRARTAARAPPGTRASTAPPRHPRLARRRRRAGRADRGVDRLEHDVVDAEDRRGRSAAAIVTKPWPTSAVANLSVATPSASRQRGRRVVVEALGVHEVLDRHARSRRRAARGRRRRCARRRRAGASGRRRGRRRARRAAAARRSRGCSGPPAPRSRRTWPVIEPVAGLASRCAAGSRPGRARTPRRACPSGSRGRSTPARTPNPRIAPHGGLLVRTAQPSTRGVRAPVRALRVGDGVDAAPPTTSTRRRRRRARCGPRSSRCVPSAVAWWRIQMRRRVAVHVAEEALVAAVHASSPAARCAARAGTRAPAG